MASEKEVCSKCGRKFYWERYSLVGGAPTSSGLFGKLCNECAASQAEEERFREREQNAERRHKETLDAARLEEQRRGDELAHQREELARQREEYLERAEQARIESELRADEQRAEEAKNRAQRLLNSARDLVEAGNHSLALEKTLEAEEIFGVNAETLKSKALVAIRSGNSGLATKVAADIASWLKHAKTEHDTRELRRQVKECLEAVQSLNSAIPNSGQVFNAKNEYSWWENHWSALDKAQQEHLRLVEAARANEAKYNSALGRIEKEGNSVAAATIATEAAESFYKEGHGDLARKLLEDALRLNAGGAASSRDILAAAALSMDFQGFADRAKERASEITEIGRIKQLNHLSPGFSLLSKLYWIFGQGLAVYLCVDFARSFGVEIDIKSVGKYYIPGFGHLFAVFVFIELAWKYSFFLTLLLLYFVYVAPGLLFSVLALNAAEQPKTLRGILLISCAISILGLSAAKVFANGGNPAVPNQTDSTIGVSVLQNQGGVLAPTESAQQSEQGEHPQATERRSFAVKFDSIIAALHDGQTHLMIEFVINVESETAASNIANQKEALAGQIADYVAEKISRDSAMTAEGKQDISSEISRLAEYFAEVPTGHVEVYFEKFIVQ